MNDLALLIRLIIKICIFMLIWVSPIKFLLKYNSASDCDRVEFKGIIIISIIVSIGIFI